MSLNSGDMDSMIKVLRDKRNARNVEREKTEIEQGIRHQELLTELKELKDERLRCTDATIKNLNIITGHRHTISKVVHESNQCTGLPISNTHHRRALDFLSDAINLINDPENLYRNQNSNDSVDVYKLSTDVQSCAQSSADSLKAIKSSIDKAEALIQNLHIIADQYNDEDAPLETSMFYE